MFEQLNNRLINYLKRMIYRERPNHIRNAVIAFKENYPEMEHPSILAAFILDFDHECERIYPFSDEIYIDAKVKYATAVFFTCISIAVAYYCANNLPMKSYYSLPSLLFSTAAVFLLSLFYITPMEHHARIRGGMKSRMRALSKDREVHKFLEGKLKHKPMEEELNRDLNAAHLGARKYRAKPTYIEVLRHLTPTFSELQKARAAEVGGFFEGCLNEQAQHANDTDIGAFFEGSCNQQENRTNADLGAFFEGNLNPAPHNEINTNTELEEEMITFEPDDDVSITVQPEDQHEIDAQLDKISSHRCNIL